MKIFWTSNHIGFILDIHLGGWPLHFWPKWVINIIKLSMQIYSFWQNSRPQSPKTALFWAIIQIERAPFVSFYSISTQNKATFGQSEIRDVFVHTATLQHSKGMLSKQDNLQNHYLCLQHLFTKNDYICSSLQYLSSLKGDICEDTLSSVEAVCMPSITTLKGPPLSIFAWFLANYSVNYIIISKLNNFPGNIKAFFFIFIS